jgi:hypothetical protein
MLVLSQGTSLFTLWYIVKVREIGRSFRPFALLQIFLKVALPIAHVVWLWNSTSTPAYVTIRHQIYSQTKYLGVRISI